MSYSTGRRWLNELTSDPTASVQNIAKPEGCSARKVNMTISLTFLAPDLVEAAIEGRLPRGMGVARLCDMPAEWPRQHKILGLTAPDARYSNRSPPPRSPFPGNAISRPENKAAKRPSNSKSERTETKDERQSPPMGAYSPASGKSPQPRD
jgi:hypothetical protein